MSDETTPDEAPATLFTLPDFEGIQPVGVVTSLTGAGQRIHRALGLGDSIILVVEAEVVNVNHKKSNEGVKRVHSLSVRDLFELEGKDGKKALSAARMSAKRADDARHGRQALPGVDDEVHTDHGLTLDENGTALTEKEVAEAKGETTPDFEPCILVFSDGSRAIWPDDYEVTDSEPFAGDFIRNPNTGAESLQIVKTLDIESGDVLEEWGATDEENRLKEEEATAKAKEEAEAKKAKKKTGKKSKSDAKRRAEIEEAGADGVGEVTEAPALPDEDEGGAQ